MSNKTTIVGVKMDQDDGFFFRWTSPDKPLERYTPVVQKLRVAGVDLAPPSEGLQCATFPRADKGDGAHQGMVLGYAIVPLPEQAHAELTRTKEVAAEYQIVFRGPRGEVASEGGDYQLIEKTPATVFYIADVPA
jgi:hypothetical protein